MGIDRFHFLDSLGGLIEKATILERKTKAARKLEVCTIYLVFILINFYKTLIIYIILFIL